jgi:hypothetical protein
LTSPPQYVDPTDSGVDSLPPPGSAPDGAMTVSVDSHSESGVVDANSTGEPRFDALRPIADANSADIDEAVDRKEAPDRLPADVTVNVDTSLDMANCGSNLLCATIDQQQLLSNAAVMPAASAQSAQTFTVGRTGKLVGANLRTQCSPGGSIVVEVQGVLNGSPDDKVLATGALTGTACDSVGLFGTVAFLPAVDVAPRSQLALVIRSNSTYYYSAYTNLTGAPRDTYVGGGALSKTSATASWVSHGLDDMVFQTLVLP